MSAEIPWTCGPGEVLKPAPPVGLCGFRVVTVDGGYTHTSNPCNSPKYHDGPHTGDELKTPDPEDARTDAEALAALAANEPRYTQAQWDAVYVEVQRVVDERDRALLRAQKAEDTARFWEAEAMLCGKGGKALAEEVEAAKARIKRLEDFGPSPSAVERRHELLEQLTREQKKTEELTRELTAARERIATLEDDADANYRGERAGRTAR